MHNILNLLFSCTTEHYLNQNQISTRNSILKINREVKEMFLLIITQHRSTVILFKLLQILLKYNAICLAILNIFQVYQHKKFLQINYISCSLGVALLIIKCTKILTYSVLKYSSLFYYSIMILITHYFRYHIRCQNY